MKRSHSFFLPFELFSLVALFGLSVPGLLAGQSTAATSTKQILSKSFTLEGGKVWTDTGITLEPGQRVVFTAEGTLRYSDAKADNGPEAVRRALELYVVGQAEQVIKLLDWRPQCAARRRTCTNPCGMLLRAVSKRVASNVISREAITAIEQHTPQPFGNEFHSRKNGVRRPAKTSGMAAIQQTAPRPSAPAHTKSARRTKRTLPKFRPKMPPR